VKGRSWKGLSAAQGDEARAFLARLGTEDTQVCGAHEAWRIRIEKSVFTFYDKGTLYFNGGEGQLLEHAVQEISRLLGQTRDPTTKEYLIGLDETGKGEVLGHAVLAVAVVQRDALDRLEAAVGTADTKKAHAFAFWDQLYRELDGLRGRGLTWELQTLPPWDVDRYNLNLILDVVYQRLLSRVLLSLDPPACRITLDDYGIGKNLRGYLDALSKQGAEIRVEAKSDEKYVEARTASVLAKWRRQQAMQGIARDFSFTDAPVGSGNAGDSETLVWLRRWKETAKPWPWFVKTSFKTVRELDGKEGKAPKAVPPIRHELLSVDAQERFAEGQLSTASLSLVCPACGATLTAAKLTPDPARGLLGRCLNCDKVIPDLDTTLRYYSGVAVLDASVIIAGSISKDLDRLGFFDGFALLLHPVVAAETDTEGGRSELAKLGTHAAKGRVDWHALKGSSIPAKDRHDEAIIETAKDLNAILVTKDGGMYGLAVARGMFCLTFRA